MSKRLCIGSQTLKYKQFTEKKRPPNSLTPKKKLVLMTSKRTINDQKKNKIQNYIDYVL